MFGCRSWLQRCVGLWALTQLACLHPAAQAPVGTPSALPPPPPHPVPPAPPVGVSLRLNAEQRQRFAALHADASAAFAEGAYGRAETAWAQAAQLNPSAVPVRLGLGRVWLLRGVATDDAAFCRRAKEAFAFVVQSCPNHAQAQRLYDLVAAEPCARR